VKNERAIGKRNQNHLVIASITDLVILYTDVHGGGGMLWVPQDRLIKNRTNIKRTAASMAWLMCPTSIRVD